MHLEWVQVRRLFLNRVRRVSSGRRNQSPGATAGQGVIVASSTGELRRAIGKQRGILGHKRNLVAVFESIHCLLTNPSSQISFIASGLTQ